MTQNGSLKLLKRFYSSDYLGPTIRYSSDVYDREWDSIRLSISLNFVKTSLNVNSSTPYELPQEVISKEVVNKNVTEKLTYDWIVDDREDQPLIYLHFAEIQTPRGNDTREFDITWIGNDENFTISAYCPPKLQLDNTSPMKCRFLRCTVELVMTQNSTVPPMINAVEAYKIIEFPDAETNPEDVHAVQNVQDTYELSRIDWQGDPCVPQMFKWEGINCTYTNTTIPPRIISLDLSSSGLKGVIPSSIQNLTHLQELDLSNNNLSGEVPEFLANMESLLIIFGIVLIEIITNRSVIDLTREKSHIAEWVKILISRGDIEKIVDSKIIGDYDSNTVWKILELAMSCVSQSSSDRPTMSKVVNVLKECLISENSRTGGQIQDDDSKNSLELTVDFRTQATPVAR